MINPFKHTANVVKSTYSSATNTDFAAPSMGAIGATLVMPVVIPFAFVNAFFKKTEGDYR